MGFRWLRFGKLELWPSCLGFFTSQFAPNCARSVPSLVPMPCRMLSAWTDFRLKAQVATTNYLVGHWWFHICFKFRSMFEMMIQHDYRTFVGWVETTNGLFIDMQGSALSVDAYPPITESKAKSRIICSWIYSAIWCDVGSVNFVYVLYKLGSTWSIIPLSVCLVRVLLS